MAVPGSINNTTHSSILNTGSTTKPDPNIHIMNI